MSLPQPAPESIALVTGASSGIGEQFARQLSERGHRVALVARREEKLASLAEELGGPNRAVPIGADLAVPEDRERLALRLDGLGAQVEVLVHSAGYSAAKAHLLILSEAVHAEVKDSGVTVTAVCPGPVPSGFQDANDAGYFAERLPKFTFVSPERVVRDSLRAVEHGRISVIP